MSVIFPRRLFPKEISGGELDEALCRVWVVLACVQALPMAFDFAWDFRNTLPFVTDPLFATFAQNPGAEPFPHVYTNGNGLTVTAGYVLGTGDFGDADRSNTVDPRIAGVYFNNNSSGSSLFKIDLAS